MLYDGSHYMGVARDAGDPARSALQVLSLPSEPEFVIGEGISRTDLARDFDIAFGRLHGAAAPVLRGVPQTGRDRLQRNLDSLVRDFRQAHANGGHCRQPGGAWGRDRPDERVVPELGESATDTAGAAVAVTEAGEDGDFEYEVEVVVPFAACLAADVASHDFALAVGALSADLYGNQPMPGGTCLCQPLASRAMRQGSASSMQTGSTRCGEAAERS